MFYGIEDFRGYRALERAKKEYLATGLRLDLDEILGPTIPDEENFADSEIVREAYADPNGPAIRLYPREDLPEMPSKLVDGTTIGFQGKQWRFDNPKAKKNYEQNCFKALESVTPQLHRFFEAAERPYCDWRIVTDPTDFEKPGPQISLILSAAGTLRLLNASSKSTIALPISLSEGIVGNLSAAKHFKRNVPLISQVVGTAAIRFCYQSLANGIHAQKFTVNDLDSIKAKLKALEPANEIGFIEFEMAVSLSRYGRHSAVRQGFFEAIEMGIIDPLVQLPMSPLSIDLAPAERFISKAIVYFVPRGWIWQGQAHYVRLCLEAEQKDLPACYTLFLFGADDYLPKILEKERNGHISLQLAMLAIEIERHRLKHDSLPSKNQFKTNSPNIGYTIEENGQPMLWYSENLPIGPPPTEKALEDFNEKHLWRYPPPED